MSGMATKMQGSEFRSGPEVELTSQDPYAEFHATMRRMTRILLLTQTASIVAAGAIGFVAGRLA